MQWRNQHLSWSTCTTLRVEHTATPSFCVRENKDKMMGAATEVPKSTEEYRSTQRVASQRFVC